MPIIDFNASAWGLPPGGYPDIPAPQVQPDAAGAEWGVEYRGVTVYESEDEARRQLNLAQMDVPAVLVKREVSAWQVVR